MDPLNDAIRTRVANEDVQDPDHVIEDPTPPISSGLVDSFSMASLDRLPERTCQVAIPDRMAAPDALGTVEQGAALVHRITQRA